MKIPLLNQARVEIYFKKEKKMTEAWWPFEDLN